ncbi:uncharacterized protein LOC119080389 isoform X2 [Bradysia coprophila]|uniref:uncharacterized protein LOC119080389 isoform X2 n=1 Tax=Bradysia coprophila TaxID=38358 RepID=UPI00187DB46B|nr:uncharacterized protein LOC119080389 isoform X2 [Bradysia coprophila]
MDYDEKNSDELEAELYSRIHHDKPETIDTVAVAPPPVYNRTVTRHSVVNNNNKMNKKAASTKNRKKAIERCNPNPFAFASAVNNHIPKRFTPYTSYLSQVDSQPIDLPNVQLNDNLPETVQQPDERRPNPFNKGFNRAEEKIKRFQQMEAKKAHANKVREEIRLRKEDTVNVKQEVEIIETIAKPISVPESDSDDEVYIYPPEEPTVISSEDEDETNAPVEKEPDPIDNLQDDCDAINVDYDKRLSRHDDPFGGIDVAHLNTIISANPSKNLPPVNETADHFAKPQRANRNSLKRSYDVSETDFAATDVYESESSDLPESNAPKGRKVATVLSESEGSDIDTSKRSKRMRKRRKSGSNRGSDCISSDDSDDDGEAYLEPEKTTRPYYLHRGEGVFNAVTKYSKRVTSRRNDQNRDGNLEAVESSEDSETNGVEEEQENVNWVVTDTVGETDDIELNNFENLLEIDKSIDENCANVNGEENESNVDKDDNNGVRSERLVIHPEMGWNNEMKAFYNDSWGGETHNVMAIRKQMPRDSLEWRIDPKDLRSNYNVLKTVKCHNCRENGHRMAFCPQPKKEIICYTCGVVGHREVRCPNTICLRCGEKTSSFRRGCERCFRMSHMTCKKCRRRGHFQQNCPDNWRAYHNTTDPTATPVCVPTIQPKRFCSVCAGYGHRAEQCYDFQLFMQDDVISSDVRQYEKVYDDPPIDNSMSTPYSMFENPRENFRFVWNVNEAKDRVYGRFLEATKFQRDAGTADTKRRQKAKIPKLDEKFVLNPMNAENIREKPKKQFAKNFYEETLAKNDAEPDVTDSSKSVPIPSVTEDISTEIVNGTLPESENVDRDVVMKETIELDSAVVNGENPDETLNLEPGADDKLMQEAIEVDHLRGSVNFSFSKEMDDLERSRALFNLSFIGSSDHEPQEITPSPTTPTKAHAKKMRKAQEIEQLTEMEISLNKLRDDIILNVTDASDQSTHFVHDSESKEKEQDRHDAIESPDYIPLPPHIDSSDLVAASDAAISSAPDAPSNSAKIFLTKQHARLLLSTDAGNKLLSDASITHQVKVRMDWENLGNVLVVVGATSNQNKFHADLIRFLVEMCKKMRIKNETFQQIPKSKMALIRFIREQFALLEQPLGNVSELYRNMKRNENLKSKNGTKNADRARKNLNIILMGRAGLRDGRLHLAGLESNLKFLLNNNKDMMTRHTREEIYQHYRYVFSSFEHDDYPDLISEYEEMKRSKTFPPLNIDKNLLEIKISVKDDANVDLNRAKQKLMRTNNDTESQNENQESVDDGPATVDAISVSEPKTSTPKTVKREPRTPKQHGKSQKQDQRTPKQESKAHNVQTEAVESDGRGENSSNLNENAVWSLKCKDIVEQCRQKHFKSSRVVDKLNTILEKASRNELSYADYKNLERIVNAMNSTIN